MNLLPFHSQRVRIISAKEHMYVFCCMSVQSRVNMKNERLTMRNVKSKIVCSISDVKKCPHRMHKTPRPSWWVGLMCQLSGLRATNEKNSAFHISPSTDNSGHGQVVWLEWFENSLPCIVCVCFHRSHHKPAVVFLELRGRFYDYSYGACVWSFIISQGVKNAWFDSLLPLEGGPYSSMTVGFWRPPPSVTLTQWVHPCYIQFDIT